ncbi:hypothetical protein [Neorickettsia sp. 179522]|uniref:hypothetical protein n=1 Tax=Neorickettsia sp. 179522 TaxID=1714371 RepID=UPI001E5399A5|nr:hypothetical protein [Neorickettsia sp. 179522]
MIKEGMTKKNPVSFQKLDFVLKHLETTLQRRIQLEKIKKQQECEKLSTEIAELKRQISMQLNEIKTLKSIIRETAAGISEVIEIIEKINL